MTAYLSTGLPVSVNTATTASQRMQSATLLSDGSFVVVWETTDAAQDGSSSAIRMQRFSASGTPLGSEVLVNTATLGGQVNPQVVGLVGGGYVVTWQSLDAAQDGSGNAIKAQIFDASGVKVGGEFLVNSQTAGSQDLPTITALSGGGFVIAWQTADTAQDGSGTAIRAQAYSATGTAIGSEFLVNTTAAGNQTINDVVGLSTGGFVVSWSGTYTGPTGTSSEIFGQAYNADGSANGAEFLITNAAGNQTASRLTALADGGFAAVWTDYNLGIQAQRFDASHAAVGGQMVTASPQALNGTSGEITTLSNGDILVTWQVSGNGVYWQAYSPVGVARANAQVIPDTTADGSSYSTSPVLALANAGFVVVNSNSPFSSPDLDMMFYRLNAAPELGAATRSLSVLETSANSTTGTISIWASDDGGPVAPTYSIVGGADAARFTIANPQSGQLTFVAGPDFEAPSDANGDNVYEVIVRAFDGDLYDEQTILITVQNYAEAPVFSTPTALNLAENTTVVTTVTAVDPEGTAVTYAISGGVDAARFTINASTGLLQFIAAPNYEAPTDSGTNNVYNLTVSATSAGRTTLRSIAVTVTDANEAPTITSDGGGAAASIAVLENGAAVTTVAASDPDNTAPTFAITGGDDAALFTVNAQTGALSFVAAPDFDAPTDADGNNVYDVIVTASDGSLSDSQAISVTVGNINEAPTIGSAASLTASENAAAVGTVAANDPEGAALTFAITGGADAALFTIDALTGALAFVAGPDFEAPGDAGGNNVYDVIVTASDGTLTDSQAISVTVGNVNEAPSITSGAAFSATENGLAVGTVVAGDPDGTAPTFAIVGGADAAMFTIDALTGALSFVATPDFEASGDADGDNVYQLSISASDGSLAVAQAVTVTLTNANEAPTITSPSAFSASENATAVGVVAATDPDGTSLTYAITGGADAARFTIDALTGALAFVAAPNFEAPTDADSNNVYDVIVSASDGALTDSQALSVTVGNVNEAPVITSNGGGAAASVTVNENTTAVTSVAAADPDGTGLTYAIVGGADAARFTINAATGALSFVTAPNWEAPTDAGGNNVYDVIVSASDGTLTDTQALAVTIGNVVDGVTLTGTRKANTLTGTTAEDTINGLGGTDTLNGGAGADTIDGGDGNDSITGGLGQDALTGGGGADTFVFSSLADSLLAAPDRLVDFTTGQSDKISLSLIDANANLAGDQAFSWIGTGAFTGTAGQLRYYQAGGDTFVTGDVNGDGLGDFAILIDPLVTLAATNFIL